MRGSRFRAVRALSPNIVKWIVKIARSAAEAAAAEAAAAVAAAAEEAAAAVAEKAPAEELGRVCP